MHWPAPCMNSLRTSIHMNGVRDPGQGIRLRYTSSTSILAKCTKRCADRNSPWRGGRERTPGNHRPRCPPCSPGTRSSWRRPATATATRKVGSKAAVPLLPLALAARKLPLDQKQRRSPTIYMEEEPESDAPTEPQLETPAVRSDPGAEMKCRDKP